MQWELSGDRASSLPLLQHVDGLTELEELEEVEEYDGPSTSQQPQEAQARRFRKRSRRRTHSTISTISLSMSDDGKAPISPVSHRSQKSREATGDGNDSGLEDEVILAEAREELGADKAEATAKVWGRYSRVFLYVTLGLAAYVYSLDQTTTYFYTPFATSSFSHHSLLSSIEVTAQVILAVGKPIIARIADLQSRSFAYIIVVILYSIGYILISSSNGVSQFAAGRVFQAAGNTGLQLLTQVIVADFTSLKWRGLISSLMSTPFIINAFVGSRVAASITTGDPVNGWRWGYGMFAILVPLALAPVILTLVWGERKAKKLGLVRAAGTLERNLENKSFLGKVIGFAHDVDIFGLLLFGTGWALLLLALTLSAGARGGWNNPSIIAMIVVGPIIVIGFAVYEIKWAKFPIISGVLIRNRAVVGAGLIGFFDFVSFYLTFLYLSSFLYVVKTPAWTQTDQNYFSSTQTVGLTLFGIISGVLMTKFRRYKLILIIGLCIRVLGVGLMIHSRGAQGSDGELVMTQLLQAAGGGFAAITSQVGAQASVSHKYVAMATAVVLLVTELGGAIGSAIAGAIWTHLMPKNIAKYLPDVSPEERARLFGSIVEIVQLPPGDPIREGMISAYGSTMRILIIVALVIGILPIGIACLMPNYYLGDAQNAVDGTDITGRKVGNEPPTGANANTKATTNNAGTNNQDQA